MEAPPTILLAEVAASVEARLRSTFQEVDFVPLPGGRRVRETLRELRADAAVVTVDGAAEPGFRLVRELADAGCRVLVLGRSKDPDLILRAMREGAREFVLAGDLDEIVRAVREQIRPLCAGTGRVYATFPAKGGVGATTLATNLAGALQRRGERTCLVDLDLHLGDVLAFLDLAGGYSVTDMIANMRRLDRELVDSALLKHASGVHVLAQPPRDEVPETMSAADLSSLLSFLRTQYAAVVLDGLRGFDELAVAALDASDGILLVVTQDVPAVRDAHRRLGLLSRLGVADRVKLTVNRFEKRVEITPAVIAETVGAPVAATVANDYPAVIRAVNRGQLLFDEAARAQVARDVEALATVLGHPTREDASERRPSFLRRFLRTSHVAT